MNDPPPLILASISRYRAELLTRLNLPFECAAPEADETARPGERPEALVVRLAIAKALAVARRFPGRWVLGADQIATLDGEILGKPGDHARAVEQLRWLSGKTVLFLTAVALAAGRDTRTALDRTTVRFRQLSVAEIERYLRAEPTYDCAGSFKCEGLGIALCEAVETADPTALVGLPLIAVRRLLAEAGLPLP